ncbi:MAG: four helix bundle protein [Daejeonella sp.]
MHEAESLKLKAMRDYKKFEVWKKAHQLTIIIYHEILPAYPKHEVFHLASQTKRAAYSIPMNIAEGSGKNTDKDFASYLDISLGSANELEYCCLLAKDLNYISKELYYKVNNQTNQVKAMLIGLIKVIRKSK